MLEKDANFLLEGIEDSIYKIRIQETKIAQKAQISINKNII